MRRAIARAGARGWRFLWLTLALVLAVDAAAMAQTGVQRNQPPAPIHRDQPVYYQADGATYDRDTGIATLTGHVEFWQGDRILLADKVTYDRNTNVVAATGNVVLLEPDGRTLFSNYAELSGGMKDGVLDGMSALLAENGRIVANGARRIDARINELSRPVYTTCNLCKKDPTAPPLWDIRARDAIQDVENKRIEYHDAVVDIYGLPVMYLPYFTHPDPSAKRESGILVPAIGYTKHLGAFASVPYYWVIDAQSDATFTPLVATENGPQLGVQYRRAFNDGTIRIDGSIANDKGQPAGDIFAKGQFALNDEWRWGFDLNRASSAQYFNDYRIQGAQDILASRIYLEGFGQGSHALLESRLYQGLTSTLDTNQLPYVAPRYAYSFVGQPDALGGRFSIDTNDFNVLRGNGTNTERLALSANWDRPAIGRLGDVWDVSLHLDTAAYSAHRLDEQPNFATADNASTLQAMPTVGVMLHWPFRRNAGDWGTQLIEPITQLLAAPNNSKYIDSLIPDEDSLDLEFTDANLFSINRFNGVDRLEGGMRANVALHAEWLFPSGAAVDALVGQAFQLKKNLAFAANSGLQNTSSDIVSHLSWTPNSYFDITSRQRFSNSTMQIHLFDAVASAGPSNLRFTAGYIYTNTNPFLQYYTASQLTAPNTPRNEITAGFNTSFLSHWKLHASVRRNLQTSQMVSVLAGGSYEDECFIFDISFYRRYTSLNNDNGSTAVLFQITLKTVGEFGFHAF
jgi:LPS-assembly protein